MARAMGKGDKGHFLYKIQKQVKTMRQGGWKRREESVITRLRIGHAGLNHNLNLRNRIMH